MIHCRNPLGRDVNFWKESKILPFCEKTEGLLELGNMKSLVIGCTKKKYKNEIALCIITWTITVVSSS